MSSEQEKRGVGRPKKPTTFVQRSIKVILPNMVMMEEWRRIASESDMSLSKFILHHVEDSLRNNGEGEKYSRKDLVDRNIELEHLVLDLQRDVVMKTMAFDALDSELRLLRLKPFMAGSTFGKRELGKELVTLFRSRKHILYDELLSLMGAQPSESDIIKGITNQIEALIRYGLIQQDMKGWRWIE